MAARLDYRKFQDVFGSSDGFPYDQHVNRDIESKRKSLDGVLFLDRVFAALGINKAKLYPPKDSRGLHELYRQILSSKMTAHHKLSALYYLLLDHDEGMSPRSKLADNFAQQTGMPKRYEIFMTGLWHMDRLLFGVAVEYLSHPSLVPEFADNIIVTLVRHAKDGDYSLPLAYYYAAQPVLKAQAALDLLFEAIACTDVTEAFHYTRKLPGPARRKQFEQLIVLALKGSGAPDVAGRASELISLPLDGEEEGWLREFLTSGDGRKLKKAKDTMIMKKIVSGDLDLGEGKNATGPWGIVLQGFKQGTVGRDEH